MEKEIENSLEQVETKMNVFDFERKVEEIPLEEVEDFYHDIDLTKDNNQE